MSAVQHALQKLHAAIGNLENCTDIMQRNLAGQQRDMFAAVQEAANTNEVDKDMLINKLDGIIESAEKILQESAA